MTIFQSTLPAWGETTWTIFLRPRPRFQSTLPAWGETRGGGGTDGKGDHFNPLSPHGERRRKDGSRMKHAKFQSTLPAWGETPSSVFPLCQKGISIHSPRMGRDTPPFTYCQWFSYFNPLSPHGERRPHRYGQSQVGRISIHSPRMGRDTFYALVENGVVTFQSTLPAWGETQTVQAKLAALEDFNPLSPHGERRSWFRPPFVLKNISIHSPRMGRDMSCSIVQLLAIISIHSPRMGRDITDAMQTNAINISIHSPRMGRDQIRCPARPPSSPFQSTLPAWGETLPP